MKRCLQAATVLVGTMWCCAAAEPAGRFEWAPVANPGGRVARDLGMLDSERDEYATRLAALAGNQVIERNASADSLDSARRLIALAFQLSPRNKRAVVVNFQLGKGVLPEKAEDALGAPAFARLLVTRSQLLEKQGGAENTAFARMFVALAAELDPRNEDAVYLAELHRLDHGPVDWSALETPKESPNENAAHGP